MSYNARGHQHGEAGQEAAHPRVRAGVLDDVQPVGLDVAVGGAADLDVVTLRAGPGSWRSGSRCATPPSGRRGRCAWRPRQRGWPRGPRRSSRRTRRPRRGRRPGSRPAAARAVRIRRDICAFCVLAQTVSLPVFQDAATARPSIGRQATRWLTMSPLTTNVAAIEGRVVEGAVALLGHVVSVPVEKQRLPGQGVIETSPTRRQRLVVNADQTRRRPRPGTGYRSARARTGSPTNRTLSTARSGSDHGPPSGIGPSTGGASGSIGAAGGGGGKSVMSATVSTATTPG